MRQRWLVRGSWRGTPRLFEQLIRQIAETAGAEEVNGRIALKGYYETFRSPEEFRDRVSPEALARMHWAKIEATGDRGVYTAVRLQRHQSRRRDRADAEYPCAGVVLRVEGTGAVDPAFERIRDALHEGARGRVWGPREQHPDGWKGALLVGARRADILDMVSLFLAPLVLAAAIVLVASGDCPKEIKECAPWSIDTTPALWPAIPAALLGLAWAAARYVTPAANPLLPFMSPIEIAEKTRARAITAKALGAFPIGATATFAAVKVADLV